MGWRFQKRIRILPGFTLNLSKSTTSLTVGRKGASINLGPRGNHLNAGLPGTGLSTRHRLGAKTARREDQAVRPAPPDRAAWLIAIVIIGALAALGLLVIK